jgi:hypothetical protein
MTPGNAVGRAVGVESPPTPHLLRNVAFFGLSSGRNGAKWSIWVVHISAGGAASRSAVLAVPPEGFQGAFLEFDGFHQDRRIPVRRGRSRYRAEQFYVRFCFADTATADAFRNRFGGKCLTYAPDKPKPRTSAA